MLPDRSVSTENDQTLTCKIEGISKQAAVVWVYDNGGDIDENTQSDYDPESGTWGADKQEATLVIRPSKLLALGDTSQFTCKVTLDAGDAQSKSMTLTKLTYGDYDNYAIIFKFFASEFVLMVTIGAIPFYKFVNLHNN